MFTKTGQKVGKNSDLIYQLEDRPPFLQSLFAALQHLLAMFVGVITPPLIIGGALGLDPATITYLVSMALFTSGIGTAIQVNRVGFMGSGLLSIQATSFAFPAAIISVGTSFMGAGMTQDQMLSTIFGVAFFGSFITMAGSRLIPMLRNIITPTVSGVTVMLIGLSLIKVGMTDFAGGYAAMGNGTFGHVENLALGALTMFCILMLYRSPKPFVRMSAIVLGLAIGYVVAATMGMVDFQQLSQITYFTMPIPFKFGMFSFDWHAFLIFGFIYLLVIVEAVGDLTATSMLSGRPVEGPEYTDRMSGGVLADGFVSTIASVFNGFPLATFSQNNGVIQMTGVASRKVGNFIAVLLVLFAIFPIFGSLFTMMPKPVLGGATLILFGTVAAAGIRIINRIEIDRREALIMAISLSIGLGVAFVPDAFKHLPEGVAMMFESPIIAGGLAALLAQIALPKILQDELDRTPEQLESDAKNEQENSKED